MSKTVKERKLDTPAARARLKPSAKPYWRAIDTGLHQGYRRGAAGGAWVGRRYMGNGNYETATLAIADDHSAADGSGILDFFQAQRRTREWFAKANASEQVKSPLTLEQVLNDYFDRQDGRGKATAGARGRVAIHVLPAIGEILASDLTQDVFAKWFSSMPKAGRKADPETLRRQRNSTNRLWNDVRAALNIAFRENKIASDKSWRGVRPFENVTAAAQPFSIARKSAD